MRVLAALAYAAAFWLGAVAANHAYLASRYTDQLAAIPNPEDMTEHAVWLLASSAYYGLGALALCVVGTVVLVLHRTRPQPLPWAHDDGERAHPAAVRQG